MKKGIHTISKTRRGIICLLSCLLLLVSITAPYITNEQNVLASKSNVAKNTSHHTFLNTFLDNLDEDDDLTSDDDSGLATDAKIHDYYFIVMTHSSLRIPSIQENLLPSHYGDLMVPPPQFLS